MEAHPGGPAGATPGAERESRCVHGELEDSTRFLCPASCGKMHLTLFMQPLFPPCPPLLFPPEPPGDFSQDRQMFLDAAEYWGPGKGLALLDLDKAQRGKR